MRRGPLAALVATVLLAVFAGVAAGAARATADAASTAASLTAAGHYAAAIALDEEIAKRTGPLFLLDRTDPQNAQLSAERTMLAWAASIERAGSVDQAVVLAGLVTDPRLASSAGTERASLLLEAAKRDAQRGDYVTALTRLDEIQNLGLAATTPVQAQVNQLQPAYSVGAAGLLTAQGHGSEAVRLLDAASRAGGAAAAAAADVYPQALLAAGEEQIAAQSYKEAGTTLQQLVSDYGDTAEALHARALLRAPQPVSGALVDRAGAPLSGQVRLSSHFFNESGGYLTTGPFYYSRADANGNFRFDSVPQGGPYVLEVFHGGDWTTFVDPNTGQPANPVSVTPLQPVDLAFIAVP